LHPYLRRFVALNSTEPLKRGRCDHRWPSIFQARAATDTRRKAYEACLTESSGKALWRKVCRRSINAITELATASGCPAPAHCGSRTEIRRRVCAARQQTALNENPQHRGLGGPPKNPLPLQRPGGQWTHMWTGARPSKGAVLEDSRDTFSPSTCGQASAARLALCCRAYRHRRSNSNVVRSEVHRWLPYCARLLGEGRPARMALGTATVALPMRFPSQALGQH